MHTALDFNEPEKINKKPKKVTIEETPTKIDGKLSKTKYKTNSNKPRKETNKNVNMRHEEDSNQCGSEFFQSSRMKKIKLPNCDISRGLVLAIIFFVLFTLLIIWFVFSSDSFEGDDDDNNRKESGRFKFRNRFHRLNDTLTNSPSKLFDIKNSNNNNNNNSTFGFSDEIQLEKNFLSTKLFVLVATVLIVLVIISLVFISACSMYYFKRPRNQSQYRPRNHNIVSSIFSHTNTRSNLYYLDQAENESLNKQEDKIKIKSKKKSKDNETPVKKSEKKSKMNPPPIIIINEESN